MGVYLVSVDAQEWFDDSEDGRGELAAALNERLRERGLPAYESVPAAAEFRHGSGTQFEEKLIPPMDGFSALCAAHLTPEQQDEFCGWSVLVPFSLDEEIWLEVGDGYTDNAMAAGAPQVLALAERLAAAIELPAEVPEMCDNLDLTFWFREGEAEALAAKRPGPWSEDLDAAFYVALYLRAAQHSIRRGCPIVWS
ncbi:hypothetical protein [Streptomyces mangrovisoli]|uniref:Uncharacterized protein n=1 Tax=Streptomyces mangrovisoli TaxID=1428628 RepID=A0A1J4P2H5_9ACTN|nr:hypothetical protein [Streptomyces mangrovisoli]OIJ68967.1 hypothetical protein WN71_005805 [Streptomyces mangrovisoli]